jgi:hypothetical protein
MNKEAHDKYRAETAARLAESERRKQSLSPEQLAGMTLADVDIYTADEYRHQLRTTPGFAERVDELEKSRPARPAKK